MYLQLKVCCCFVYLFTRAKLIKVGDDIVAASVMMSVRKVHWVCLHVAFVWTGILKMTDA